MPLHYVIILAQIHTQGFTEGDLNGLCISLLESISFLSDISQPNSLTYI